MEIARHVYYYIIYNGAPFLQKGARLNLKIAKYKKHFREKSFKYNFKLSMEEKVAVSSRPSKLTEPKNLNVCIITWI